MIIAHDGDVICSRFPHIRTLQAIGSHPFVSTGLEKERGQEVETERANSSQTRTGMSGRPKRDHSLS